MHRASKGRRLGMVLASSVLLAGTVGVAAGATQARAATVTPADIVGSRTGKGVSPFSHKWTGMKWAAASPDGLVFEPYPDGVQHGTGVSVGTGKTVTPFMHHWKGAEATMHPFGLMPPSWPWEPLGFAPARITVMPGHWWGARS